jgi:hypothetical protein
MSNADASLALLVVTRGKLLRSRLLKCVMPIKVEPENHENCLMERLIVCFTSHLETRARDQRDS